MQPNSSTLLPRLFQFLMACGLVLFAANSLLLPLRAQDADAEATTDESATEGAETTETTSGTPAASSKEPAEEKNMLIWIAETSGIIGLVLLGLSVYFVATVVRMFMELKPEVAAPPEIVRETENLIKNRDFMGAYKLVKGDNSFFSQVLSAGIADLPQGIAETRETMDRVGDSLTVDLERKISMLAVLGSLGPMIGLLGTLKGMIASFSVIALSDTQLKASQVAEGISEALVLTFEGVGLSVPAIYFFAVFRNRVAHISSSTMLAADELIRRIHSSAKTKPGTQPANPQA